ncbi:PREDICTED: neurexin-3-like, partial [Corvus brachyrhynchos]|uniref:neurexin-3-like n=1 Tax=Corvus brachyrhynchos TaxID=85066 RepID=UPI0008164841
RDPTAPYPHCGSPPGAPGTILCPTLSRGAAAAPRPGESPTVTPAPGAGVSVPEASSAASARQDLVRRGGCLLLWLALLLGCWAELGSGLEFPGAEGQWTRFPKWNACCESEMSFNMKTRSSSGLVLYFDDEGFCDFLELLLTQGGRLQLSFSIFCAEPATLLSDTDVRVNYTQASPVESQEVRLDDEQSRLCARDDVCLNGGVCSVLNDQAVCDCSQTGFRGKDCSEGKGPFQLAPSPPSPSLCGGDGSEARPA